MEGARRGGAGSDTALSCCFVTTQALSLWCHYSRVALKVSGSGRIVLYFRVPVNALLMGCLCFWVIFVYLSYWYLSLVFIYFFCFEAVVYPDFRSL